MQETWVWSLGWEDPLKKGMATHSSSLAWRIPRTEEPGGLQSMGWQRVRHNWTIHSHTLTHTHTHPYVYLGLGFPGGLAEKIHLPMQETRVWSLGQEDPPEEEMETHSSILAWEIPLIEEACQNTVYGVSKDSDTTSD